MVEIRCTFPRRSDGTARSLLHPLPPSALRIRRLNAKKRRRRPRRPPGPLASGQSPAFVVSPLGSDGYGLFKRISRSLGASFCSAAQALPPFECLFVSLSFYRRANDSPARRRGPSRERCVDERQCAPRSSGSKETKKRRKKKKRQQCERFNGGGPHPPAARPSAKVEGSETEALVSPLAAQPWCAVLSVWPRAVTKPPFPEWRTRERRTRSVVYREAKD